MTNMEIAVQEEIDKRMPEIVSVIAEGAGRALKRRDLIQVAASITEGYMEKFMVETIETSIRKVLEENKSKIEDATDLAIRDLFKQWMATRNQ